MFINTQMAQRYTGTLAFAGLMTFSLFYAMGLLIAKDHIVIDDGTRFALKPLIPRIEEPFKPKSRTLPPKETVETPPPPVAIESSQLKEKPGLIPTDTVIEQGSDEIGLTLDSGAMPIVMVSPIYPTQMAEKGIEGDVMLEFTISALGTVENISLIHSSANGGFDKAAILALSKFRFKPMMVNGKAVVTHNVRRLFTFTLPKEE